MMASVQLQKIIVIAFACGTLAACTGIGNAKSIDPTQTQSVTPSPSPSPSPSPAPAPNPTPNPSPNPAPNPSPNPAPTPSPQPGPTPTPTPSPSPSPGSPCGIANAAFCDTFDTPSTAVKGRGGDLDPAKWATSRLSGEILSSGQGRLNSVSAAAAVFYLVPSVQHCESVPPLSAMTKQPQCRVGIDQMNMLPPNDTLICDASGSKSGQLMTAVGMQNYGVNSYMPRQPFDFAGRVGKIVFDVDPPPESLGGMIEIEVTDTPLPATTFREYNNFEVGPVPNNGISIKFISACHGVDSVAPANTMVYKNHVGTIVTNLTWDPEQQGCSKISQGSLNHFEIQLSQTQVSVYGSDFSTDGKTFSNFKLIYQAPISLNFTRGYVHFNARNHASMKYGIGLNMIHHWDNIGFDGPVIAAPRAYEIPDNTTTFTADMCSVNYLNIQHQNLGYLLLDGTTGKAAGMYSPDTKINSLTFKNVDISGMNSAMLTMNMFVSMPNDGSVVDTTWGLQYRFNGTGAWRTYNFTQGDLDNINNPAGAGPLGMLSLVFNIDKSDLKAGNNTIEFLPLKAPMSYPPVVANIDLLLSP